MLTAATARAIDEIAARERDVLRAYVPGAVPEMSDVARAARPLPATDGLCATAPEQSYFVVASENGKTLFTQDGTFAFHDGKLVDSNGNAVLGYSGEGAALEALHADPVDVALGVGINARVDADGTVVYDRRAVDPRTGRAELQRISVGRIALARFAPGTKLQRVDTRHLAAPAGIFPHTGKPGDSAFGKLAPGYKAAGTIDIDLGLDRLQEAYIALDAIRAANVAGAGAEKIAMDLLK